MHKAAADENVEVIKLLSERLPYFRDLLDEPTGDEYRQTPVHIAIEESNFPLVKLLHEAGADLLRADAHGESALHTAAALGNLHILDYVLREGRPADVDMADSGGATPLMAAAHVGHMDVINLLLEHGASLTQRDPDSESGKSCALELAVTMDHAELLEAVINEALAYELRRPWKNEPKT